MGCVAVALQQLKWNGIKTLPLHFFFLALLDVAEKGRREDGRQGGRMTGRQKGKEE